MKVVHLHKLLIVGHTHLQVRDDLCCVLMMDRRKREVEDFYDPVSRKFVKRSKYYAERASTSSTSNDEVSTFRESMNDYYYERVLNHIYYYPVGSAEIATRILIWFSM